MSKVQTSWLLDLRYRIEYAGLRLLIGFVRLFPIDLSGSVSAKLWRVLAPLHRRHKRALANLERAFPEKTPEERERIALAAWENLGRVMVETMMIDKLIEGASRHPGRTLFAARGADGAWVSISYAAALQTARSIGQALLGRGLSAELEAKLAPGGEIAQTFHGGSVCALGFTGDPSRID